MDIWLIVAFVGLFIAGITTAAIACLATRMILLLRSAAQQSRLPTDRSRRGPSVTR